MCPIEHDLEFLLNTLLWSCHSLPSRILDNTSMPMTSHSDSNQSADEHKYSRLKVPVEIYDEMLIPIFSMWVLHAASSKVRPHSGSSLHSFFLYFILGHVPPLR